MKKRVIVILICIVISLSAACGNTVPLEDTAMDVSNIIVTSASVDGARRLLTVTAASKGNDPAGGGQSPQLAWEAVPGAACYAVVMYDTDANWLHWLETGVTATDLPQGAYTEETGYTGPYPPSFAGEHHYRIEVFALAQAPDSITVKTDARADWEQLVADLNTANGAPINIIARGHVVGTYAHGDDTM